MVVTALVRTCLPRSCLLPTSRYLPLSSSSPFPVFLHAFLHLLLSSLSRTCSRYAAFLVPSSAALKGWPYSVALQVGIASNGCSL